MLTAPWLIMIPCLDGSFGCHLLLQEQMSRMIEAQDQRVVDLEKEYTEKLREIREQKTELAAKVDALKDANEGGAQCCMPAFGPLPSLDRCYACSMARACCVMTYEAR